MNDLTGGVLDRLGLMDGGRIAASTDLMERVQADGVETVRFLFPDHNGTLRGKALVADAVLSALRNGVTAPSSLMLKDSSSRTAFAVWSQDAGFGPGVMTGAGDLLMVPDPESYHRLPWSPGSAWVLCDIIQTDGAPIPFASHTVLEKAEAQLADEGLALIVGLEVEFHVYTRTDTDLDHAAGGMPGTPPQTAPLNHGYQLLSETAYDSAEPLLDALRRAAQAMGMPIRSIEVEFGPSQFEVTFEPAPAHEHARTMVMFRSMVKEVCARQGLHATFMCRPVLPHAAASGWHVHQSLVSRDTGDNVLIPGKDGLSPHAEGWIAGLLAHAAEACVLTTPTINGYKRYQPGQLAPDRIQWGHDNKGAMLRVLMQPGDTASRIENRAPEPAANPYYVFAAQILSGLAGLRGGLTPPAAVEKPYDSDAPRLPTSLAAAIEAFDQGELFATFLGAPFTHFISHLKHTEWTRYVSALSEWEQREYFQLY